MPKPYDASGKQLIEWRPADWLVLAGLPVPASAADVTLVDADLSAVTASVDKLIRVDRVPGGPYLAHVDLQAGPDPRLDERMVMYNSLARWHHGLPVRSVVYLLREAARTPGSTGRFVDVADPAAEHRFAYRLIPVWELPVERLLTGEIGTVPLATLAGRRDGGDLRATARRVQERVSAEIAADRRADVWATTKILMGCRYPVDLVEAIMQSVVDMKESSVWQAIHRDGRQEGIADGELRVLVKVGTARFGPPTNDVRDRLTAVVAGGGADRLTTRLMSAVDWDDLFAG